MWEEIVQLAVGNGIFAVMFVYLLMFELKDSRSRENKYQQTIDTLSKNLGAVENISQNVNEMGKDINEIKTEIKQLKTAIVKKRVCPLFACNHTPELSNNSTVRPRIV